MAKHHDRRHDDVQWTKEPRPEGVDRSQLAAIYESMTKP